jgi:hypothetical protein
MTDRRTTNDRREGKERRKDRERRKAVEKGNCNIYEILYPERRKNIEVGRREAVEAIRCYFDIMAKVYSFLDHDAQKIFPKLGANAARTQLVLAAIQMYVRSQSKESLKAVRKVLREEEKYSKDHEGSAIAAMFMQIKPQVELLIDSHL